MATQQVQQQVITWQGKTGRYDFGVFPMQGTEWNDVPGLYIMCYWDRIWWPQYIGQCESFRDRISDSHHKLADALRHGSTHIHAMVHRGGQVSRRKVEVDLLAAWKPPCNELMV